MIYWRNGNGVAVSPTVHLLLPFVGLLFRRGRDAAQLSSLLFAGVDARVARVPHIVPVWESSHTPSVGGVWAQAY